MHLNTRKKQKMQSRTRNTWYVSFFYSFFLQLQVATSYNLDLTLFTVSIPKRQSTFLGCRWISMPWWRNYERVMT